MRFWMLASGSKGNCFVLKTAGAQIVIDCGTTRRYLTQSFRQIEVDWQQSDALLLTHGHRDHISQLKMFSGVRTYASFDLSEELTGQRWVRPLESFCIGDIRVTPVPLSHDAPCTVGYLLETARTKLVYITDTGYLRQDCLPLLKNADYYVMESNHDVGLLMKTSRPYPIKMRILSDSGHLCNEDCAALLSRLVGGRTRSVVLAHLSEEANDPALALETTVRRLRKENIADGLSVSVAAQYEILEGGDRREETADSACLRAGVLEFVSDR